MTESPRALVSPRIVMPDISRVEEIEQKAADLLTKPIKERSAIMLDTKKERVRAEGDVKLLANRLAHLRAEEAKALKKIEETRERAAEIASVKKRNEDTLETKIAIKTVTTGIISAEKAEISRRREQQKLALQATRAMVQKQKMDTVVARKDVEKRFKEQREEVRAADEERKRALRESVQRQEAARRAKREQAKREQDQRVAEIYARRMEEERLRVAEADRLIRQMEEEEQALIDRLRNTQIVQREAYEELQKTLMM